MARFRSTLNTDAPPLRAVIHTRVPSDPHEAGRSVAAHERDCRAVCQRFGSEVVLVFTDNDPGPPVATPPSSGPTTRG